MLHWLWPLQGSKAPSVELQLSFISCLLFPESLCWASETILLQCVCAFYISLHFMVIFIIFFLPKNLTRCVFSISFSIRTQLGKILHQTVTLWVSLLPQTNTKKVQRSLSPQTQCSSSEVFGLWSWLRCFRFLGLSRAQSTMMNYTFKSSKSPDCISAKHLIRATAVDTELVHSCGCSSRLSSMWVQSLVWVCRCCVYKCCVVCVIDRSDTGPQRTARWPSAAPRRTT